MHAPEQWYGPLDNSLAREELGFDPRHDLDGMVGDYTRCAARRWVVMRLGTVLLGDGAPSSSLGLKAACMT